MQLSIEHQLKRAKTNGAANLASIGLETFPQELCRFGELQLGDNWWQAEELTKIDLSYNEIPSIPPELATQGYIIVLRMCNNQLTSLPDELFSLQNLKVIDFSRNNLRSLPEAIAWCQSLVEIQVQANQLQFLPQAIGNLTQLETFNLADNQLERLPDSFANLHRLTQLNLTNNQISEIPHFIGNMPGLQELNCAKNRIQYISPQTLTRLQSLRLIDLTENRLEIFDQFPPNIDTIQLGFNQLRELSGFETSTTLTVLDVKNNKLEYLPDTISQCSSLKTLDVSNNDLRDLPNTLALIRSLVRINVEGNPLKTIRQSVKTGGAEILKKFLRNRMGDDDERPEGLISNDAMYSETWDVLLREAASSRQFRLPERGLTELPEGLWGIRDLQVFDVSNNQLKAIPEGIGYLQELCILKAQQNMLDSISGRAICDMYRLQEIDLSINKLTSFMEDVDLNMVNWGNLQRLNLSSNRLRNIPYVVLACPNLMSLYLHANQIGELSAFCQVPLPKLEQLDLSANRIADIPENMFEYLTGLSQFNIENNELANLPVSLGFNQKITLLRVDGNPLRSIRRTIIEKGTLEILAFLRNRATPEEAARFLQQPATQNMTEAPIQEAEAGPQVDYAELQRELQSLNSEIAVLSRRLEDDFSLTTATKRTLHKELAMMRSRKLRVEEMLKQLQQKMKEQILNTAVTLIKTHGWTEKTLIEAAMHHQLSPAASRGFFPDGPVELVHYLNGKWDTQLHFDSNLGELHDAPQKERLFRVLQTRLGYISEYRHN